MTKMDGIMDDGHKSHIEHIKDLGHLLSWGKPKSRKYPAINRYKNRSNAIEHQYKGHNTGKVKTLEQLQICQEYSFPIQ